jgi:hypothetical protein
VDLRRVAGVVSATVVTTGASVWGTAAVAVWPAVLAAAGRPVTALALMGRPLSLTLALATALATLIVATTIPALALLGIGPVVRPARAAIIRPCLFGGSRGCAFDLRLRSDSHLTFRRGARRAASIAAWTAVMRAIAGLAGALFRSAAGPFATTLALSLTWATAFAIAIAPMALTGLAAATRPPDLFHLGFGRRCIDDRRIGRDLSSYRRVRRLDRSRFDRILLPSGLGPDRRWFRCRRLSRQRRLCGRRLGGLNWCGFARGVCRGHGFDGNRCGL